MCGIRVKSGGQAVAEVLFGDYSPAGRLPITFPQSVAQVPLNYDHKPTGRNDDYIDMTGKPLFPFGFGLSYSTFDYSGLSIAASGDLTGWQDSDLMRREEYRFHEGG